MVLVIIKSIMAVDRPFAILCEESFQHLRNGLHRPYWMRWMNDSSMICSMYTYIWRAESSPVLLQAGEEYGMVYGNCVLPDSMWLLHTYIWVHKYGKVLSRATSELSGLRKQCAYFCDFRLENVWAPYCPLRQVFCWLPKRIGFYHARSH